MMEPMAAFIAKVAIERDAEAVVSVVETEADSVAVAAKEAGTNRTEKQSPIWGLFFCISLKDRPKRFVYS